MLEEDIKKELELISEKVNTRWNTPWRQEASKIIAKEGKMKDVGETCFPGEYYIENGNKGFKFYDNYRDVLSKSNINDIIEVLKNEGYQVKDNEGNFV